MWRKNKKKNKHKVWGMRYCSYCACNVLENKYNTQYNMCSHCYNWNDWPNVIVRDEVNSFPREYMLTNLINAE